jgi:hypothetical protein
VCLAVVFLLNTQHRCKHIFSTEYRRSGGPKNDFSASFILTAPGTVQSTSQIYLNNGYRLLGESVAPLRNEALTYAQQIGATLVIYSVEPVGQEIHPVTKTVMDQPGRYITTNSTTKLEGNSTSSSSDSFAEVMRPALPS